MRDIRQNNDGTALTKGAVLFNTNCAACHALDAKPNALAGGQDAYPNLRDVGKRLSRPQIVALLETGRDRMPSFRHISREDRTALIDFLLKTEPPAYGTDDPHKVVALKPDTGKLFPYATPYINNGNVHFLDPDNYPAVKPPWGTLNAVDLNTGEYLWQVPLGEYPELAKKGSAATGTENHGGPLVTAGGLLFIGASYDAKLKAYDTRTGKLVWQYQLPAGGFATPITYRLNGIQYIAIAAGGQRQGLPAGGSYVAFALP